METGKLLKQSIPYLAIIILAAIARIVPHAPNFAPIAGLALFTGHHLKNKLAWIVPITAMVLSDAIIGFHSTVPYVYASFFVISVIGVLMKKANARSLLSVTLVSSVLFFLVTNFGVWMTGSMYAKNVNGLVQSYLMGVPFFRNTVLGDLFYSFAFFYGFRYLGALFGSKLHLSRTA